MFTDIHYHIVYGVDDGAKDFGEAKKMLLDAVDNGVTDLIATSHVIPGYNEFPARLYEQHLFELKNYAFAERLNICIHRGCEILFTDVTVKQLRTGMIPTMADGTHVLVEFLPTEDYSRLCHAALTLSNAGYTVILAHVERYQCLREKGRLALLRKEYQVKAQMNANTVLTAHGLLGDRWVKRAIKDGLIDYVASDAHNVSSRPCRMKECMKVLEKDYGSEAADRLCISGPAALLSRG